MILTVMLYSEKWPMCLFLWSLLLTNVIDRKENNSSGKKDTVV